MQQHPRHPMLEHLDALVGQWETEATHQSYPGTVVRGRATFEWLEGGHFLIWRARNDHPDFPDSIAILGCVDSDDSEAFGDPGGGCSLRYFDSRGVARRYALGAEAGVWRFWQDWPGFSQRFTGALSADRNTIAGVAELCEDGTMWREDLRITYKRVR
jgi:hypothetical protein